MGGKIDCKCHCTASITEISDIHFAIGKEAATAQVSYVLLEDRQSSKVTLLKVCGSLTLVHPKVDIHSYC